MAKTFQFELLTPEGPVVSRQVEDVTAPGREGYFGVRAGHTYFVTTLKPGGLTIKWDGHTRCYKVSAGVIQVTPDKVVVCAESAELMEAAHR